MIFWDPTKFFEISLFFEIQLIFWDLINFWYQVINFYNAGWKTSSSKPWHHQGLCRSRRSVENTCEAGDWENEALALQNLPRLYDEEQDAADVSEQQVVHQPWAKAGETDEAGELFDCQRDQFHVHSRVACLEDVVSERQGDLGSDRGGGYQSNCWGTKKAS